MRMSLFIFIHLYFQTKIMCTRCEKYSSKLDISRSFLRIFEINLEDTFTRCEKYSSKLDISRSFLRIFAIY